MPLLTIYSHDTTGPAIAALPEFLKEHHYQDITSSVDTAFQKGHNTELSAFVWIKSRPERFERFNQFMVAQRQGLPSWLDVYPYQEMADGLKPEQPFFVDIGGGFGHQSIALREKLPDLANKIVVQDIPATLEHAIKHPRVEIIAQDFFRPQETAGKITLAILSSSPILMQTGAKIYYMRNIIHDWPDEKALFILENTKAALGPDSVILIDDIVIPNTGAPLQATQLDLVMMISLASLERTKQQWENLTERAGLKIKKIYTYATNIPYSVIECVPA
jgi:demethylsterigmatocystin 6-O-methyltransferase